MLKPKLHYIYDPLCGWCYAASPLLQAAAQLNEVELVMHSGGMMVGASRRQIDAEWRDYVMPYDHRIAALTGLAFGDAYFNGLLLDHSTILDSLPPTAAILAFERLGFSPLTLLHAIQKAHYQQGRKIANYNVLLGLVWQLGVDTGAFSIKLEGIEDTARTHIENTRKLMKNMDVKGFPSLLLESNQGWQKIEITPYLGKPQAFVESLLSSLPQEYGYSEPVLLAG